MKRTIALLFLLFCLHQSFSQQSIVYLSDILEEAIFSDKEIIEYSDVKISHENIPDNFKIGRRIDDRDVSKYLLSKYPKIPIDSLGRIIVNKEIKIKNSSGDLFLEKVSFEQSLSITGLSEGDLIIDLTDCVFNGFSITNVNASFTNIGVSTFFDSFYIESTNNSYFGPGSPENVMLIANNFRTEQFEMSGVIPSVSLWGNTFSSIGEYRWTRFVNLESEAISFVGNSFDSTSFLDISGSNIGNLELKDNFFKGPLYITKASITERFRALNNQFDDGFGFSQSLLPELFVDFDWKQLSGNKLFVLVDETQEENGYGYCPVCLPYFGMSDEELSRNDRFRELVNAYTKFYRINKENGDITSANGTYIELQDLYTRRYEYLSRTEGGLANWFRWRLNQLLEYYVSYGTDPAKALVISFYIIICFAVFYFFFPSEWDVTSKQKLLEQIRSAINKHEKGTSKAVVKASGLFLLSFINAFTLSLNSFVTLGFGIIPTTGLARYVCIIQGFMGWFLLSLFTVALINQVIF